MALCVALCLLVCVALLLCVLCVVPRSPRVPSLRAPDVISVERVASARAARGDAPWLVAGLPAAPELRDWALVWGVRSVRALLSRSGVFGAYGACESSVRRRGAELEFACGACSADPRCRPVHETAVLSPEDAVRLWSEAEARVYLRGTASPEALRAAAAALGWGDLANLTAYQSMAGCTTNLHWDGAPGLLAQSAGEKDVVLFAPGTMPAEAPAASPCARRSYHAGACPPGEAARVRLRAGYALYIPAHWAHHVSSLSPVTLGAVWRFRA
jgi:hypothetical protein